MKTNIKLVKDYDLNTSYYRNTPTYTMPDISSCCAATYRVNNTHLKSDHKSLTFPYMPHFSVVALLDKLTQRGTRASKLVDSYTLTAENYPKVIETLTERFGRPELLQQVYVRDLIRLMLDCSSKQQLKVTSFYDISSTVENGVSFSGLSASSLILLQTLKIKVEGATSAKVVRALLDTGSQRTYILSKTAQDLGLSPIGQESLKHVVFGGHTSESVHQEYRVNLGHASGNFKMVAKLLDQQKICGNLPRLSRGPWLKELKARRIWVPDIGKDDMEIEILLGCDVLGSIFMMKSCVLSNGLTASQTRFGWTLMGECQPEAVMNGRPMTYVSNDPNDLETISPSMFLQEQTDVEFPECQNMGSNPTTQKLRYLSKLREELKSRFRKEYLSLLVQRNRRIYNPKLQAGDVVLVGMDNKKRNFWPLAVIEEILFGRDEVNRLVKVKTAVGTFLRPIQKIYPLEISSTAASSRLLNDKEKTAKIQTRSGRTVCIPNRLDDYYCFSVCLDKNRICLATADVYLVGIRLLPGDIGMLELLRHHFKVRRVVRFAVLGILKPASQLHKLCKFLFSVFSFELISRFQIDLLYQHTRLQTFPRVKPGRSRVHPLVIITINLFKARNVKRKEVTVKVTAVGSTPCCYDASVQQKSRMTSRAHA
ncbi:hypothetical protein LAZ67_6003889 [Cordylochernes scorpioides]|uniref:DUF5641 domain-containing protein n=1 Tax=Cordylochernes scorpioides TaxID=51811 RepID=A0ABY6KLZ1_9ARAC|nr:hypothetical protein LAZ67_6003889 [Cordylochernes scorpioides]